MEQFDDILKQLAMDEDERLLVVARFAELGVSTSAVVHELRQPLAALKMSLQLTLENSRGADAAISDGIIESLRLVGRTEMLLERARDFMTPHQGLRVVDVTECIARVVSLCHWQIKRHPSILIHTKVDSDIPLILGEKPQVEQMLSNLVGNAIDSVMDKGSGDVTIIGGRAPDGGAEIMILDTGNGISEEDAAHIFEPFYSTKEKSRGTGLGLYLVSKMAAEHRAKVELMKPEELATVDGGAHVTGFRVRFPEVPETQIGVLAGNQGQ